MKKVLKNKYSRIKKSALALGLSGVLLFMPSAGVYITEQANAREVGEILNSEISKIIATEEFEKHKEQMEKEYYEMYKQGDLSIHAFNERVEKLDSVNYVYSVRDLFVSAEKSQELKSLWNKIETHDEVSGYSAVGSIIGAAAALASIGIYDTANDASKKQKTNEIEEELIN